MLFVAVVHTVGRHGYLECTAGQVPGRRRAALRRGLFAAGCAAVFIECAGFLVG